MPTFEITIYTVYRSTNPTNLSLLMNLAAMEGLDIGVGDSPKGSSQSRLQSSVADKDGTFFQHTRKMASPTRRHSPPPYKISNILVAHSLFLMCFLPLHSPNSLLKNPYTHQNYLPIPEYSSRNYHFLCNDPTKTQPAS